MLRRNLSSRPSKCQRLVRTPLLEQSRSHMNFRDLASSWKGLTSRGKASIGTVAGIVTILVAIQFGLHRYLIEKINKYVLLVWDWRISVPILLLGLLGVTVLLLAVALLKSLFRPKRYRITIRDSYQGSLPNEYQRRTRWHFKDQQAYYYIPWLSQGYETLEFVGFCGPYCSKCDHILHVHGPHKELGRALFCVRCNAKHRIPKELLDDYANRLYSYFKNEFLQRRLKQAA